MPNDVSLTYKPGDFPASRQYLRDARKYVSSQVPPQEGFKQKPHSDDLVPVGSDPTKPAILDASYVHHGRHLLSISFPDFIQEERTLRVENGRVFNDPGFSATNLGQSLQEVLERRGIKIEDVKFGHDKMNLTRYIEYDVSGADYDKGREVIKDFVHGRHEFSPGFVDSRLSMAGDHAMNLLGFVPIALSVGSDIEHGNIKGAITTGSSFAAITAAPTVIAKVATLTKIAPVAKVAGLVGEKAIPIVGSAFGAIQGGVEAHHDFATGHVARGWLDTVKAGAYGTAAVAGVATAADCWNPTVIAPALVTGGALALGATIDAGQSLYDHRQGILNGAKSMWDWATGGSEQNHVEVNNKLAHTAALHTNTPPATTQKATTQGQAHTGMPDPTRLPASHTGTSAGQLKVAQSLAPDTATASHLTIAHQALQKPSIGSQSPRPHKTATQSRNGLRVETAKLLGSRPPATQFDKCAGPGM